VAQLTDEGQFLLAGVRNDDDVVCGLMEDVKEISTLFDQMKFGIRRKLVDLKQIFETTVVEVSVCLFVCLCVCLSVCLSVCLCIRLSLVDMLTNYTQNRTALLIIIW